MTATNIHLISKVQFDGKWADIWFKNDSHGKIMIKKRYFFAHLHEIEGLYDHTQIYGYKNLRVSIIENQISFKHNFIFNKESYKMLKKWIQHLAEKYANILTDSPEFYSGKKSSMLEILDGFHVLENPERFPKMYQDIIKFKPTKQDE